MTLGESARTAPRRTRTAILVSLAIGGAALLVFLIQLWPSASTIDVPHGDKHGPPGLTMADGSVPDGVTVFANDVPAVTKLNPALLDAVRKAAKDAEEKGIQFVVNSGWRSPEHQERLLRDAISKYGSKKEAARWVATAETSLHVSGDAVDLGPAKATTWLAKHGAEYGLCQIYGNEPWHYELRPKAIRNGCPPQYPDPTKDPRLQR
ncbi:MULTISPECIES: M15 family metallopeptidase [unclassified Crossiella]|uniref:M15 family metallopeptidase n=1 Tax=unclassified Crossiella TaxID=2620835 RepID=UPI001FFF007B|nr:MULTISPECIES: M15 family metallopeptidase [unclassified Crossiella]MCK2239501.1 M15 family metallopeptidase [Crossiella sp. S99.2]MCK2252196.1 M15 family metallopeptidase [Crossiella sp. S99.1]